MKPMSGASPKISVGRLNEGEGEARRKAGLMECSESLLLLLPNSGQWAGTGWWSSCCEQPAEGEAAALETSTLRGVVFGVPEGHKPGESKEWTILSSTSLVLWVHCERKKTEKSRKGRKSGSITEGQTNAFKILQCAMFSYEMKAVMVALIQMRIYEKKWIRNTQRKQLLVSSGYDKSRNRETVLHACTITT